MIFVPESVQGQCKAVKSVQMKASERKFNPVGRGISKIFQVFFYPETHSSSSSGKALSARGKYIMRDIESLLWVYPQLSTQLGKPKLASYVTEELRFYSKLLTLPLRLSPNTPQRKLIQATCIHSLTLSIITLISPPQVRVRMQMYWYIKSFSFWLSSVFTTTVQQNPHITPDAVCDYSGLCWGPEENFSRGFSNSCHII